MTLKEARILYTEGLIKLIVWGNQHPDWQIALGRDFDEANEKVRHMKGSLHYIGLANDLALYVKGEYQETTEAYYILGQHWETMNKEFRWGGRFKKPDGNHFSMAWEGKA